MIPTGLFKGKRVDNGEWIEGSLLNFRENTYIIPHDSEYCYDDTEKLAFDIEYFEVIPETVGQYTELTDKNNKKIFSGDMVRISSGFSFLVVFKDGCYVLTYENLSNPLSLFKDCEVVGNIHDTLGVEKKVAKIFKFSGYFVDPNGEFTDEELKTLLADSCDIISHNINVEEQDIGEWEDDNPLNLYDCPQKECEKYFSEKHLHDSENMIVSR